MSLSAHAEPARPLEIFLCYAHEDELLTKGLVKQLTALKRQGFIDIWYDRQISAGTEWERDIDKHLDAAQIILLLVSPDFMVSDYCYGHEMKRAIERHVRRETRVIPVILRPVFWKRSPFGNLQALPTNAKAVISWGNQDEAFFDIAEGIRVAVEEIIGEQLQKAAKEVTGEQLQKAAEEVTGEQPHLYIPNQEVLVEGYNAVRDGKITDPMTIREIAGYFETIARDPEISITFSFDAARAAQALRHRAEILSRSNKN